MAKRSRIPAISEVMTVVPYTIGEERPIDEARSMMSAHKIRHLPVVSGKEIIGVLGEAELQSAALAECRSDIELRTGDLCYSLVVTVRPDEPLDDVLEQMAEKKTSVVLILQDSKLMGIFTSVDACRRCAALLRENAITDRVSL